MTRLRAWARLPPVRWRQAACAVGTGALAACTSVAPPPAAPRPPAPASAASAPVESYQDRVNRSVAACHALRDDIATSVPAGQSIRELSAQGVTVANPLTPPAGTVPRPRESSATAVQGLIDADGRVIGGSAQVLRSIGDPSLGPGIAAALPTLSFTLDAAAAARAPIRFTTIYIVCNQRPPDLSPAAASAASAP